MTKQNNNIQGWGASPIFVPVPQLEIWLCSCSGSGSRGLLELKSSLWDIKLNVSLWILCFSILYCDVAKAMFELNASCKSHNLSIFFSYKLTSIINCPSPTPLPSSQPSPLTYVQFSVGQQHGNLLNQSLYIFNGKAIFVQKFQILLLPDYSIH